MNPFVSELQDVSVTKLIFIYWKSKRLVVPVGWNFLFTNFRPILVALNQIFLFFSADKLLTKLKKCSPRLRLKSYMLRKIANLAYFSNQSAENLC